MQKVKEVCIRGRLIGSTLVLLFLKTISGQQTLELTRNPNGGPCPGGRGIAEVDVLTVYSLENMIAASDLIVYGVVSSVPPAILSDSRDPSGTETNSVVVVRERLYGTLPPNVSSFLLAQAGGTVGPCSLVVDGDPLPKVNEEYVLFLKTDKRPNPPAKPMNLPRYFAMSVWSGKAKIVDGRIQFPKKANLGLHKHDNTEAAAFITLVKQRIGVIFPQK